MTTRHIGVREFRDKATRLIASGDVLAIQRHGSVVGYFVPVPRASDLQHVEAVVERLRAESAQDVLAFLRAHRQEIREICLLYGASNTRVFGSVVRGTSTQHSDVDFLVDLEAGRSLFDLAGLACDLEELIGRPVDVVLERSLKPMLRERVLNEAEPL
jgi:predicted nucleotidyltransferase